MTKLLSILLTISIITLMSCTDYQFIRTGSIKEYESIPSEVEYIQDSIQNYINQFVRTKSKSYQSLLFSSDSSYQVDPLILFNSDFDKLYTTINEKSELIESIADNISELYGVKVNNQWYFFRGPTLYLPREYYQYDSYEPLTFEELSYLAHNMRHRNFLVDKGEGKYEVNKEKIDAYITPRNVSGVKQSDARPENEIYISEYYKNLQDTITAKEIININKSKEKAAAEFVWRPTPKPKKTPIFETKAWKNRHK